MIGAVVAEFVIGRAGTGLGLAVCHGILESAGGHLQVVSAVGEGSTFSVQLPLVTIDQVSS